jgi:hypothetical protein
MARHAFADELNKLHHESTARAAETRRATGEAKGGSHPDPTD